MNTYKNKKTKSKKWWVITLCLVAILLIGFSYKWQYINAYYFNYKFNNYKFSDTIYVTDKFLKDTTNIFGIELLRLAKNKSYPWDYYLVNTGYMIKNKNLSKFKTPYIGTYLDLNMVSLNYKGETLVISLFAFEPNWKGIDANLTTPYSAPSGYDFVDKTYYIMEFNPYIKYKH